MIKELRLGNYVKTTISRWRGQGFPILAIKQDAVSFDKLNDGQYIWVMAENLKPIPLSPEILEKCGFKEYIEMGKGESGLWEHLKSLKSGYTFAWNYDKRVMIMHPGNSISHWLDVKIEYLHQLQNLYFALTGEELEVNLTVV